MSMRQRRLRGQLQAPRVILGEGRQVRIAGGSRRLRQRPGTTFRPTARNSRNTQTAKGSAVNPTAYDPSRRARSSIWTRPLRANATTGARPGRTRRQWRGALRRACRQWRGRPDGAGGLSRGTDGSFRGTTGCLQGHATAKAAPPGEPTVPDHPKAAPPRKLALHLVPAPPDHSVRATRPRRRGTDRPASGRPRRPMPRSHLDGPHDDGQRPRRDTHATSTPTRGSKTPASGAPPEHFRGSRARSGVLRCRQRPGSSVRAIH